MWSVLVAVNKFTSFHCWLYTAKLFYQPLSCFILHSIYCVQLKGACKDAFVWHKPPTQWIAIIKVAIPPSSGPGSYICMIVNEVIESLEALASILRMYLISHLLAACKITGADLISLEGWLVPTCPHFFTLRVFCLCKHLIIHITMYSFREV